MRRTVKQVTLCLSILTVPVTLAISSCSTAPKKTEMGEELDRSAKDNVERLLSEGKQIFRFNTFGSEAFWGDSVAT
jgi:hypothetical protein